MTKEFIWTLFDLILLFISLGSWQLEKFHQLHSQPENTRSPCLFPSPIQGADWWFQPGYRQDHLCHYQPSPALQSDLEALLVVTPVKDARLVARQPDREPFSQWPLSFAGILTFEARLPTSLPSFRKKRIKTELFRWTFSGEGGGFLFYAGCSYCYW